MRHLEALCLLMEERWIRLDLLAQLLGVPVAEARRVVEVCIGLGLVEDERILVKERYAWAWPTRAGVRATGSNLPSLGAPRLPSLTHAEAAARVRILLAGEKQPHPCLWRLRRSLRSLARVLVDGLSDRYGYVLVPKPRASRLAEHGLRWVSERELFRRREAFGSYVPDALLESRYEEHALLIGLGPRSKARIVEILTDLSRAADTVSCFCFPKQIRQVEKAVAESGLRRVNVVPMPEAVGTTSLKARLLAHAPRWLRAGLHRLGLDIPASVTLAGTVTRGKTSTARDMFAQQSDSDQRVFFTDLASVGQIERFVELLKRSRTGPEDLGLLDRLWLRLCLAAEAAANRAVRTAMAIKEKLWGYVASLNAAPSEAQLCGPPSTRFDQVHFETLCLLDEEECIWMDQLARLLGSTQPLNQHQSECLKARATVRAFLSEAPQRTRLGGLVRSIGAKVVTWLADKAGYSLSWKPAPGVLQSDDARWVHGTAPVPRHPHEARQQLADAFLEVEGKSTAILIEPFVKRSQLTAEAFRGLGRIAHTVCCYCSPQAKGEIKEVVDRYGLVNVLVTDIPELSNRK